MREATRSTNAINYHRAKNNKTGCRGIWQRKSGKWAAEVWHQNKKHRCGLFLLKEDAIAARNAKAKELFGEFAREG